MPPKTKAKAKVTTARQQNVKKKIDQLFEEKEPLQAKSSKVYLKNIVQCFNRFQHGYLKPEQMRRYGESLISEKLKKFEHYLTEPFHFDRRLTALRFHPTIPYILAMGDKSGTFVIKQFQTHFTKEDTISWDGIGPGGSITDISFDPFSPNSVFTSSIDGTVQVRNYSTKTSKELLNTGNFESWYCSVHASHSVGLAMAGDTSGNIKLLNKDLKLIDTQRLHKKKLNTIDFSRTRGWLFATASLDTTVKLWDVRKLDPKAPINTLQHVDPVNSAYFCPTDGNRLLTTDQHNEVRVYKGPMYDLENKIAHPHRQFQHLTPIKANWHPLSDIIVVGRYPDPKWPSYLPGEVNSIDIISAETGEMITQLSSVNASGIVSLNSFNSTGEILASAMGLYVLYRKERNPLELSSKDLDNDNDQENDEPPPPPKRSRKTASQKCPKGKGKSK